MLLRYSLDCAAGAAAIEAAVGRVLDAGLRTADIARPGARTVSTRAMGDAVVEALRADPALQASAA